ncbi:MAG: hypothetical protein DI603_08995 [Roseateles depolymerans]|uniref:CHASE2 domain-containing protein n=1 Tax=Roseateles depolymerans TaxID=76731 RepID=A0A2W5DLQ3_9BURK|nr:MAG: hypothetical protein DI603_08995 [Roseateles depolymerans]
MAKSMKRFIWGIFVASLLIGSKLLVEATPFGHWAEEQTYSFLAGLLPNFAKDGAPVQVLDISHLGGRISTDGKRLEPTDRKQLLELLNAVAQQQPLAIGVDSDFSPSDRWTGGWVTNADPAFFEDCQKLSKRLRVPIYLGVFRSIREQPKAWLGVPAFKDMAAGLWLPKPDARRLPLEFRTARSETAIASGQTSEILPSLGAALARSVRIDDPAPLTISKTFLELDTTRKLKVDLDGSALLVKDSMVDYSFIDQMEREVLIKVTPDEVRKNGDRLRGRVVLLGNATDEAGDKFPVPIGPENRNGIFLHAVLASSLIAHPLYEFKHGTRLLLDAVISSLLVGAVVLLSKRTTDEDEEHAVETRVLLAAVAIVLVSGIIFLIASRIVWLDFLLVVFFLLVHPSAESRIKKVADALFKKEAVK